MNKYFLSLSAVLLLSAASVQADAPVAPVASTSAEAAREKLLKQFRVRGFKEKFRKGDIVWCRKESSMGTRFAQSICLTEAELAQKLKTEAALQQELGKGQICNGEGCVQN